MTSGTEAPIEERQVMLQAAGIGRDGPLAEVLARRAEILALSEASHDAVLTPAEPGGVPRALRAAIALRVARAHGDGPLADHYARLLDACPDAEASRPLADRDGHPPADPRLAALVAHADLLAFGPARASRADIDRLRAAGVEEPDIVRLAELVAFLGYQLRVVAGLRLLGAGR